MFLLAVNVWTTRSVTRRSHALPDCLDRDEHKRQGPSPEPALSCGTRVSRLYELRAAPAASRSATRTRPRPVRAASAPASAHPAASSSTGPPTADTQGGDGETRKGGCA